MAQRDGRFDTSPLTRRVVWSRWRRFRREALNGEHGQDLVERRWWSRAAFGLLATIFVVGIPAMPIGVLVAEGPTTSTIVLAVLWTPSALGAAVVTWWMRRDFWGPRARSRFRLAEFARVNQLEHQPEPDIGRLAAHIFNSAPKRRHLDRVVAPGPRGFAVANYDETWGDGIGESYGFEAGYVVFGLWRSYPHTLVARQMRIQVKELRNVEPVEGPAGLQTWSTNPAYPLLGDLLDSGVVERALRLGRSTQIEIKGAELFVLCGPFRSMTSPHLWRRLDVISEALAPFVNDLDDSLAGR